MSDLISRQAAIDALNGLCDRECEYSKEQRYVMCGACHLGSAFDVIEQLPSAEPRWIPVSEKLPQALEEVLVTSKYGHVYTSRIVHGEFEYGGEVIAWMPLPKPYEVKE